MSQLHRDTFVPSNARHVRSFLRGVSLAILLSLLVWIAVAFALALL